MRLAVFVLRGGLIGIDGPADSFGMDGLAAQIRRAFPDAKVSVSNWTSWRWAAAAMRLSRADKKVLIGYSGGGSRATWIAQYRSIKIDLLVAYDPSPISSMARLHDNVRRALCFYNSPRLVSDIIGGLGGGKLTGAAGAIETVRVSEWHLSIQSDQRLHDKTLEAIGKVINA